MTVLINQTITTAVTAQVTPVYGVVDGLLNNLVLYGELIYGSGGTTADAWVQTQLIANGEWMDVANFHFTTSTAKAVVNLSSLTSVTTPYTPTNGTLASNTVKDGLLGPLWRILYTTTGTYAGGTILRVDGFFNGPLRVLPAAGN